MQPAPQPNARDDVTASELNTHAFCAKAWHLEYVLRVAPDRVAAERREVGEAHHVAHGQAIEARSAQARLVTARAAWFARLAAALLLAGVLLAALTVLLLGVRP